MIPSIILEGPDGSGKTTAAKFLVEWLGIAYRHDGPPPSGVDDKNCLHYYGILYESFPKPFVWDRSIFGELVYGPIFRNGSRLTNGQVENFMREFSQDGGISVLLLPPLATVLENWQKNHAEQLAKATQGESEESMAVKRSLMKREEVIVSVWEAYQDIAPMFDEVIDHYPTVKDWIAVIGQLEKQTAFGGKLWR